MSNEPENVSSLDKGANGMQMPEMFDNVSKTVKDDLMVTIKKEISYPCGGMFLYLCLSGTQEAA